MIGVGGRVGSCCAAGPGQPGVNNRPPDTATAVSASDTSDSTNRRPMAAASATIAVIASANPLPVASGITGSASTARSHTVNTDRTASARSPKRRSQPRTVSAGQANSAAIRRNPTRRTALATNADTTTAPTSARRSNAVTGNNTWVTRQSVQRDRRGHNHTGPSAPRSSRGLARPQPANTPLHAGHRSSPAANLRSTRSTSASTVTTAPPKRTDGPPARLQPETPTGGAVAYNDVITVPPRHRKHQTSYDQLTSYSSSTPDRYPVVLNLNAPEHVPAIAAYLKEWAQPFPTPAEWVDDPDDGGGRHHAR